MNKLKMKIMGFNLETHDIQVTFASDKNLKKLGEYPTLNFSLPVNFSNISDPEKILKEIAKQGIVICEMESIRENAKTDSNISNFFNSKIGETFEFDVNNLKKNDGDLESIEEETINKVYVV
jgi:hypothetical protein